MSPSNIQVRTIQNLLRLHGFSPPVNGKFDWVTWNAYNKFCYKNNFPQQKYFFNKRKAIKDLTVKLGLVLELKSGVGPNKNKAIKEYIKKIQSKLQEKGHKINSDGIWGKNTDEALKEFQKNIGIPPTGEIKPYLYTDVTWLKLMKGNSSKPLNEPTKSALEIIRKYMPYTRVVLAHFFASAPAYKKDTKNRNKMDENTKDYIISKLEKKGYGYMHKELIKKWDMIVDAGSKYQYIKGEKEMTKEELKEEKVKWANNVKKRTPKMEDKIKHFFWDKVACICNRILIPSGAVPNLNFFSLNDNNKYLLKLDNNKLNRLPDWINIGDEMNKLNNFEIKKGSLSWGTSWSLETLNRIDEALKIRKNLWNRFFKKKVPKSIRNHKITITSLSPQYGYRLFGVTHKTGLDIDFRVITSDGNEGWTKYKEKDKKVNGKIVKGKVVKASEFYNQEGQRFFLELLNELNKLGKIKIRDRWIKKDGKDVKVTGIPIFNDGKLIDEKLCRYVDHHHNHVHLEIGEPPILATK